MDSKTLTDPDGDTITLDLLGDGLLIRTRQDTKPATVRGIDPHELIAAIREVAGIEDAEPESCERHVRAIEDLHATIRRRNETIRELGRAPAPTTEPAVPAPPPAKPTAEDFARAEFARHPHGSMAVCVDADDSPWYCIGPGDDRGEWHSDDAMARDGWQIVTPAPTTAREALALFVSLCHEPEGDRIPTSTPLAVLDDDGFVTVRPHGYEYEAPASGPGYRRLLLDPPTPRAEGAEAIEATLIAEGVPAETARRAADRIARERAES